MRNCNMILFISIIALNIQICFSSFDCSKSTPTIAYVTSCPKTKSEWESAAKKKKCNLIADDLKCVSPVSNFQYHCLMNQWQNATLEVCASMFFLQGYCAVYNTELNRVAENYRPGFECFKYPEAHQCPPRYASTDAYKYQRCYTYTELEPQIKTPTASTSTTTTTKSDSRYDGNDNVKIVFLGILSVLVIGLLAFIFWKHRNPLLSFFTKNPCNTVEDPKSKVDIYLQETELERLVEKTELERLDETEDTSKKEQKPFTDEETDLKNTHTANKDEEMKTNENRVMDNAKEFPIDKDNAKNQKENKRMDNKKNNKDEEQTQKDDDKDTLPANENKEEEMRDDSKETLPANKDKEDEKKVLDPKQVQSAETQPVDKHEELKNTGLDSKQVQSGETQPVDKHEELKNTDDSKETLPANKDEEDERKVLDPQKVDGAETQPVDKHEELKNTGLDTRKVDGAETQLVDKHEEWKNTDDSTETLPANKDKEDEKKGLDTKKVDGAETQPVDKHEELKHRVSKKNRKAPLIPQKSSPDSNKTGKPTVESTNPFERPPRPPPPKK